MKEASKGDPNFIDELRRRGIDIEAALKQGQTAAVLVVSQQLANLLEHALQRLMRDLSKNKTSELFENTAPLSTFSAKIKLAYALRLLDDKTVVTADCIRNIRNCFAHARKRMSFDDKEVRNYAKNLPNANKQEHLKDVFVRAVEDVARKVNAALHNLTKTA